MNYRLYIEVKEFKKISPNNINTIKISDDGNCLLRSLSYFIYNTESINKHIIKELFYKSLNRKKQNEIL